MHCSHSNSTILFSPTEETGPTANARWGWCAGIKHITGPFPYSILWSVWHLPCTLVLSQSVLDTCSVQLIQWSTPIRTPCHITPYSRRSSGRSQVALVVLSLFSWIICDVRNPCNHFRHLNSHGCVFLYNMPHGCKHINPIHSILTHRCTLLHHSNISETSR